MEHLKDKIKSVDISQAHTYLC